MRRSVVEDEEKVLSYLLSRERDTNNCVPLGTNCYSKIDGLAPERFVQTLCALQDMGYVRLQFIGRPAATSFCYVTLTEYGLTHFEDQASEAAERASDKMHDLMVGIIGAAVGVVIDRILTLLI